MYRKLPAALGAAVSLAVLTAAAGLALAEEITGTPEDDVLTGTPVADQIHGLAGNDQITGGKGDDWLFGEEGYDTFYWTSGDGHDRIDGGRVDVSVGGTNSLEIAAGNSLRLHMTALGPGSETATKGKFQVISVKNIQDISIVSTEVDDRLVLALDQGVQLEPKVPGNLVIDTGAGDDDIDVRKAQVANVRPGDFYGAVIYAGAGDDAIWTGKGSWTIFGQAGANEIHLGRARNFLYYEEGAGTEGAQHDTVYGFGDDDFIVSTDFIFDGSGLDTNGDRRLDARDETVTVRHGGMTIDLSSGSGVPPGTVTLTLIGRTRLSLRQIVDNSD